MFQDLKLKDNEFSDNVETYNKEVETLHKEIKRKDDLIKCINEDYENLQKHTETVKNENNNLKLKISRLEDTNRLNIEKISELENEKLFLEKQFHSEQLKAKNYKLDIANLHENFESLKMNYEMLLEKQEILNTKNDEKNYASQINQVSLNIRKVK